MSNLPDDLICREILLRSPAESLFRFRAVCKRWRTVIDDPKFARAHTIHHQLSSSSHTLVIRNIIPHPPSHDHLYTFDLDAVNFFDGDQEISGSSLNLTNIESSSLLRRLPVSTCNGLILVYPDPKTLDTPLEIWNLSTHERLQLPPIDVNNSDPVFVGLGYDNAAQDFKAVAMDRQQTHIYSLRSDAWRTIGDCLFHSDELLGQEYHGFFLGGALHWLFDDNKIIAFDLGTEKHHHIQLNALQKTLDYPKKIDVLGGCLVLSGYSNSHLHVWVMKDYGSDDESWTNLFSIYRVDLIGFYTPIAYMKDKNQVFLKDFWSGFILFDFESDSMKKVCIKGLTGYLDAQIIPRSIFRLCDHCGGSGTSRIISLCQKE